ncbi:antiviral reverse transcriptase Drt5 [Burkholderia ubonensis]|uniref:antiviral reverse transcriptase Drt5 n=1 Tax=Burkholderia ubonensis TaxID=101571 RepID=UPI00075D5C60|nr:antiviral reverse transcriptase Drt5 [Burkholderia ubonensis]KVO34139.1 DNA polymerase [Burkholderia ubonensis]
MSTIDFLKADIPATLFPLKLNLFMAENHGTEISTYINEKILKEDVVTDNFLAQQRVYATKPRGHLRRTVKLDPIAEYFIYDLVYRNRGVFRPEVSVARRSFGYRFKNGSHIPVHVAYMEYKKALEEGEAEYKHKIQFDIASYFNSIYHHDLSHWFSAMDKVSALDANAFGKYMREINAGRSVDFLPQGIYPCKMIGNEFLKYIDLSKFLKSSLIVRFMDDFTIFDNDPSVLQQDFIRIQHMLGQYGLNINPSKTHYDKPSGDVQETLSNLQNALYEIVREIQLVPTASGVEAIEVDNEVENNLSQEQIDGLLALLKDDALDESDAERILIFLRSYSDSVLEHIPALLARFPNLMKHIHAICGTIKERNDLAAVILDYLKIGTFFLEYQLFWLGCIAEDFLSGCKIYGDILLRIYELSSEFKIARSKILEIPEQGFGFKEIRADLLKNGQSDWLSWAAAIGMRSLKSGERNYLLDYFAKASTLNFMIADCVKKL